MDNTLVIWKIKKIKKKRVMKNVEKETFCIKL